MIRQARLTDRHALVELAKRACEGEGATRRTLGLPGPRRGSSPVTLSALMPSWMPLRQASLHLVAEEGGRIIGSCRAIEEPRGGDWIVVELDAAPVPMAAEIRYELLSALVDEARHRNVARYHAACAEAPENLELFAQLEFVAYAAEEILYRPVDASPAPATELDGAEEPALSVTQARAYELRRAESSDAWHLFHLWSRVTPPTVARAEGYGASDWELAGHDASVPRSSLSSLLRPTEVRAWMLPDGLGAAAFAQVAVGRSGPCYLRLIVDDATEPASVLHAVLAQTDGARSAGEWLAPVRTYEQPVRSALVREGFRPIGTVNLLVRDVRARIRQPALVPAIQ